MPPPLTTSRIDDATLNLVFASDQSIYPAPLTLSRLRSWTEAAPDLSIAFYDHALSPPTLIGVIIVLPLRLERWERLLTGALKESDIDPASCFRTEEWDHHEGLGLHVFHVERYGDGGIRCKGFAGMAMRAVEERVGGCGRRVEGWSALTATEDGRRAFERMEFVPTGYEEVFVPDGDGQEVKMVGRQAREKDMHVDDGQVVARTQMVVRYGPMFGAI